MIRKISILNTDIVDGKPIEQDKIKYMAKYMCRLIDIFIKTKWVLHMVQILNQGSIWTTNMNGKIIINIPSFNDTYFDRKVNNSVTKSLFDLEDL